MTVMDGVKDDISLCVSDRGVLAVNSNNFSGNLRDRQSKVPIAALEIQYPVMGTTFDHFQYKADQIFILSEVYLAKTAGLPGEF